MDLKKMGKLPTMTIKGKEYVMVKDRVRAFRDICPGGSLVTEIVSDDGTTVTIRATVSDEDGKVIATGHAQEVYNATQINRTSALENCETSAIGRALGLCGIGIDDNFASANEMTQALGQQAAGEKHPAKKAKTAVIEPAFDPDNHITKVAAENLESLITQAGADKGKFLDWYKVDRLDQLTQAEYVDAIDKLEEKIHKHEGMDE